MLDVPYITVYTAHRSKIDKKKCQTFKCEEAKMSVRGRKRQLAPERPWV